MRPPIMVLSPVSTSVTRQGSAAASWTSILLRLTSNVTFDMCKKVVLEILLDDIALVSPRQMTKSLMS